MNPKVQKWRVASTGLGKMCNEIEKTSKNTRFLA